MGHPDLLLEQPPVNGIESLCRAGTWEPGQVCGEIFRFRSVERCLQAAEGETLERMEYAGLEQKEKKKSRVEKNRGLGVIRRQMVIEELE